MPDVSGSIDSSAIEESFKSIAQLITKMHRGDRISVIPITGDAEIETSDKILRFEVPSTRQAYDSDLREFANEVKSSLRKLESDAISKPGGHTDILGAIHLAAQDFAPQKSLGHRKVLIILSDFIQDDAQYDFIKDQRLASQKTAKEFGVQTARTSPLDFKGIRVYLGLLKSKDYLHLAQVRRRSIQEFWGGYFRYCGADTSVTIDGPGLAGTALNE